MKRNLIKLVRLGLRVHSAFHLLEFISALYETAYIDISSTKIRNLISRGENPIGLIPGSIWSYIKRNKLYTEIYD